MERDRIEYVSGGASLFLFQKRKISLTNAFLDAVRMELVETMETMD